MKKLYKEIKPLYKSEDIFNVSGNVILIIGGAGKMGQAFAKTLSLANAVVIMADINGEQCNEAAKRISEETGKNVSAYSCDAADENQVIKLFAEINSKYGTLDSLICNTMTKPEGYYTPFEKYSGDIFNKVLEGNLTSAFLAAREASKYMKNGGSIIFTSSEYGITGPDQRIYIKCSPKKNIYGDKYALNAPGAYCASKAGLIGLCKYLATLLAEKGIRVNCFVPHGVYDGQEEAFHSEYIKRVPLGRMAVWSDYNGAIMFLCSPASRYMTGSSLIIDGGWNAW